MVVQTGSKIYKLSDDSKMDGENLIEGKVMNPRHTRNLPSKVVMATVIVLMFVCLLCMVMFFRQMVVWSTKQMNEFKMKEENNIQEMHLLKQIKNNNSAIFWNFQSGYQTVRTQSKGEAICFVFQIDNTSHASIITKGEKINKPTKTNVFQVSQDISHMDDKLMEVVGIHAFEACKNIRVMWLAPYPVDLQVVGTTADSRGDKDGEDDEEEKDDDDGEEKKLHRRYKRNIRSCRTSCCYRVCCCDVHHFIWEVAEEFNCNHVCNKCSSRYRPIIQRIC